MNGRRRTVVALAAALAVIPALARERRRVVLVRFGPLDEWRPWGDGVVRGLADAGFVDGRDVEILRVGIESERRSTAPPEETATTVRERVMPLRPDVLVTAGPTVTRAIHLLTKTVPIVTRVPDPVEAGFAATLARPGGNVTGLAEGIEESAVKSVELARRLVPRAMRIGIFTGPAFQATRAADLYVAAANGAKLEPVVVRASHPSELAEAFRGLASKGIPVGCWVWPVGNAVRYAEAALEARVPVVAPNDEWVEAGFLASYHAFEPDPERRLGAIAAQVLRGARPADLPFRLPTEFRLAVNRRTAKALGITLPPDLLLRADRVVE